MKVSVGTFTKGLGFPELAAPLFALAGFVIAYWLLAVSLLRKQQA
jgi:hypothetical protein